MKAVLIGAGQRGMIYAEELVKKGHQVVAVAELDAKKRNIAAQTFGIPQERVFEDALALLQQPAMGEAAIIATMDRDHFSHAIPAMEKGYHLLLEKPISPLPEEVLAIAAATKRLQRHVVVCHVLRYSPFFRAIKQLIDAGEIGRVLSIQHNENIGNYHFAHSFVRGNWRRADEASSLILQKSCHDMDLLVWFTGSTCKKVASFGDLSYFRSENAPPQAAKRCADCPLAQTCRFSAYKVYLPIIGSWPASVLTTDQTEAGVKEAIRTGPYGRCVYHCDNDVCDQQVSALEFDNGITATFNLSAFTNRIARSIKIMGTNGELHAMEENNEIRIIPFSSNAVDEHRTLVIHPSVSTSGHNGGDSGIVNDFLALLEGRATSAASDISQSIESHMMACAAEEARINDTVVSIQEFKKAHGGR